MQRINPNTRSASQPLDPRTLVLQNWAWSGKRSCFSLGTGPGWAPSRGGASATLRRLVEAARHGLPEHLCSDNGPEFTTKLEATIEQHLHGALGYEVATFVRTPGELRDTIDIRGDELHHPDHSVYVAFTHSAPDSTVCDALVALESGTDRFEFRGREVY